MNSDLRLFGFDGSTKPSPDGPVEFISHHMIGWNPNNFEDGAWDTEIEAMVNFALQFAELAREAQGHILFVRRAPEIWKSEVFDSPKTRWRMIGRFSIAKLKEVNA